MMRLRTASIRYETGLAEAIALNHWISISSRGAFIDERKRKTKSSGKRP